MCGCGASSCPECMGGYRPNGQPFEEAYRSALERIARLESTITAQAAEIERLKAELAVTDPLLNERQRVLDAVPPCPAHGSCVPHALEWIAQQSAALSSPPEAPK